MHECKFWRAFIFHYCMYFILIQLLIQCLLKSPRKLISRHSATTSLAWQHDSFCLFAPKVWSPCHHQGWRMRSFFKGGTFFGNFLGQKSLVRLTKLLSRQKSGLTLARAFKREQNHHTKEDGVRSRNTALQGCWIECCRLHQRHACFYSWIDYKFKSYGII